MISLLHLFCPRSFHYRPIGRPILRLLLAYGIAVEFPETEGEREKKKRKEKKRSKKIKGPKKNITHWLPSCIVTYIVEPINVHQKQEIQEISTSHSAEMIFRCDHWFVSMAKNQVPCVRICDPLQGNGILGGGLMSCFDPTDCSRVSEVTG